MRRLGFLASPDLVDSRVTRGIEGPRTSRISCRSFGNGSGTAVPLGVTCSKPRTEV